MRTLTVKLYNSDDFGYLDDVINIAGIIYNTALTIIQDHYTETVSYTHLTLPTITRV